nr:dna oxidative demethylase alkbh2 [Quercus suber]
MLKRPRTLDTYFSPPPTKKSRATGTKDIESEAEPVPNDQTAKESEKSLDIPAESNVTRRPSIGVSTHPAYPFPIARLPPELVDVLNFCPATEPRIINDQPDLDIRYYQPYIPPEIERDLFTFLRRELPFYRVKYSIQRGSVTTQVNTPRFTTVFGLDETSRFSPQGSILDATTSRPLAAKAYKSAPRPIPACLDFLKTLTENSTGHSFNFALVNYYADGADSISYHSDDERFLGPDPAIASFTLGARRDFLLRHKPTPSGHPSETTPMKLPLSSGDMLLMQGPTQRWWLHSIPKRTGKADEARRGRINITFRRAMVKGGTENYYRYNVGEGKEVYRWDESKKEMVLWS